MTVESRIRALERVLATQERQWVFASRRAVENVHRATATMEQYRLVYGQSVRSWRDSAAGPAEAYVTLARLGTGRIWQGVVGYPPDMPLPSALNAAIAHLQVDATSDEQPSRRLPFVSHAQAAQRRKDAAQAMLILGDLHGVRLRRHLWRIDGEEWVLSKSADLAGQRDGFPTPAEAETFLSLEGQVTQALLDGEIAALPGGGVSYAELNRAVQRLGWATQRQGSWSNQVRSGQGRPQPLCKDLQTGVHHIDCIEKSPR